MESSALLSLTGVNNWEEIRGEKRADLQRVALLNQMQQQELSLQQEAAKQVQDHLNTIGKIKVLDNDHAAIQAKEKDLSKSIQEGVQKYGGNVKKYLLSGGLTELQKYQQNLVNSDEVQRGLMNAFNHNRYQADLAAGLTPRPVSVDGKTMSYGEQFDQYNQGKVKNLQYHGGFAMPEGDPRKEFAGVYGNAEMNPQEVNPEDVFHYWLDSAKKKGLSEQDAAYVAQQKAGQYLNDVQKNKLSPYLYKSADPVKRREQAANLALKFQIHADKVNAAVKASPDPVGELFSGRNAIQDYPAINADATSYATIFGLPTDDKGIGKTIPVQVKFTPLTDTKIQEGIAEHKLGLTLNKKEGTYSGQIPMGGQVLSATNMMPVQQNVNSVPFKVDNIQGSVFIQDPTKPDGVGKHYIKANLRAKPGDMEDLGFYNHHYLIPNTENASSQGASRKNADGTVSVPVLLPAEPEKLGDAMLNNNLKAISPKFTSGYGKEQQTYNLPGANKFLDMGEEPVSGDNSTEDDTTEE